ncbi:hypothetical protein [Paenibacillus terreus]|uniref:hypothetical protein n=1 Tax=Paenibacillus terreus TaxID=1387834 RepID=UPI0035CD1391
MNIHDVQWFAGQIENISKSMIEMLKERIEIGADPVSDHHMQAYLKQIAKLTEETLDKYYKPHSTAPNSGMTKAELDDLISLALSLGPAGRELSESWVKEKQQRFHESE